MQTTHKLYYEDVYCQRFRATVLACEPTQGARFRVALDATAFYPEGGGQPADRGALGGARVEDVHEQAGVVWHTVTVPLRVGEVVCGSIDWARRYDLMQQHTGEHVFSGILHALFGCENVGFHIGEDAVRVDFDKQLTHAQLEEAERATNDAIRCGDPVEILWPDAQALTQLTYRSKKELEGAVRIVRAGTADVCACCGLHVRTCAEVRVVKVLSAQNYKGGTRALLLCGERALDNYLETFRNNAEISVLLSAKPLQTAQAVRRLQRACEAQTQRAAALEQRLFAQTAKQLAAQGNAPVCVEEALSPDSLRRLCQALCAQYPPQTVCAVFSPQADGFAYALGSAAADVRPVCRTLNEACHGRGGGKPGLAQGSVACTRAQLDAFCAQQLAH